MNSETERVVLRWEEPTVPRGDNEIVRAKSTQLTRGYFVIRAVEFLDRVEYQPRLENPMESLGGPVSVVLDVAKAFCEVYEETGKWPQLKTMKR